MSIRDNEQTIKITAQDLDAESITSAVERAKEAAQVPLRREVGAADLTKGFNTQRQVLINVAAAVAAAEVTSGIAAGSPCAGYEYIGAWEFAATADATTTTT